MDSILLEENVRGSFLYVYKVNSLNDGHRWDRLKEMSVL